MAELLTGCRFRVFAGGIEMGFQRVSGVRREIEMETYREGGVNDRLHVFPKGPGGEKTLTMEKGVAAGAAHPFHQVGLALVTPLIVQILDGAGQTAKTYTFLDPIIKSWQPGELHAGESRLLIDQFEISYSSFLEV